MLHGNYLPSQGGDHAKHAAPEIQNLLFILFYHPEISFYANFQVPTPPSCAIVKDPFPKHLRT